MRTPQRLSPVAGAASREPGATPSPRLGPVARVRRGLRGLGPQHQVGACGQHNEPSRHQVAQSAGHPMPDDGAAHAAANDEPGPGWLTALRGQRVHDNGAGHGPTACAQHEAVLRSAPDPARTGQHERLGRTTPTAGCGPCRDERRARSDRRGCSSGCGIRACGHADDCSAGTCASWRLILKAGVVRFEEAPGSSGRTDFFPGTKVRNPLTGGQTRARPEAGAGPRAPAPSVPRRSARGWIPAEGWPVRTPPA